MKAKSTLRSVLTLTTSTLLAVSYTHAADYTWDSSTTAGIQVPATGTWTATGAGWSSGTGTTLVNWAAANVAIFGGADGTYAVTVGGAISAQKIRFSNSGYTLSAASAQAISLTDSGGTTKAPQLNILSGKAATIGSNVTVQASSTFYIGADGSTAGGTLNIEGGTVGTSVNSASTVIDGAGTVVNVKTGGTLKLSTSTTSSGSPAISVGQLAGSNASLNVQGGSVLVNNSGTGALYVGNSGQGTVTLTTGTIEVLFTASNGVTFGNATASGGNVLNLDGGILTTRVVKKGGGAATATFNFNGGLLKANATNATFMQGLTTANVLAGGAKIDTQANNITIAQKLEGAGGLTKEGTGSLTLAGPNTYNGATTVNLGKLKLSSAGTSASNVTVTGGAAGALVAATDGQHVSTANLSLNSSTTLVIDYGTTAPSISIAPLQVADFTLGTGIGLLIEGTTPPVAGSTYPLVQWTGTGPSDGSAFSQPILVGGLLGTLSVASNTLSITFSTVGPAISWNTGNGDWDTTTSNWLDGGGPTTYTNATDPVLFGDAAGATGNPVVTLGSVFSPVGLTMNSTARDYTISGAGSIAGTTGLTLDTSNTGTLNLATANTYTGPTAINGGTLSLGDGGVTGSLSLASAITVASGATFAVKQSDTVTQGTDFAAISGGGGFAQIGGGTTALALANTYTGPTAVDGGTLSLGNGDVTGSLSPTSAITVASGATFAVNQSDTVTQGTEFAAISGGGGFAQKGGGTTALTLANTYSGVTLISAGTLQAATLANGSSNSSIGSSSNAADNLILNGGTLKYTGAAVSTDRLFSLQASSSIDASGTGAVNFTNTGAMGFNSNTDAKTLTLSGTNTGANTLAAIIGNNTGATSLTKSGSGTWLLSGANTYDGATIVNLGTLAINHNDALGSTVGATTINGGNGGNAVILSLTNATSDLTISEPLNFFASTAGRARLFNGGIQNHTLTGPIDVSSAAQNVEFWANGGSCTITGDITGTMTNGALFVVRGDSTNANNRLLGSISLTGGNFAKTDGGTWLVGAPGKTYSWVDTTLVVGTLKMGLANVLPSSTILTMGSTSSTNPTLDLNGFNQTVGGIIYSGAPGSTGTRTITNSATATPAVLTVNNTTDYSPTAGTLTNSVALTGNLGLTKQGVGKLTFSGNITYSGNTTVSEGILSFAPAGAPDPANANTGNDLSTVTIADTAATLNLTYTGTDKVDKLFIDGTQKAAGVYGALLSGAQFEIAQITGTGTLTVATGPAASYTAWALINAGGEGPELDSDKDGVENGVEFFMNSPAGFTANPQLNASNTITWPNGGNIPASAYGTQFVVETSSDLSTWTPVPVGSLTTNTDGPGGSLTYTLSGTAPRFVRLQVTPN